MVFLFFIILAKRLGSWIQDVSFVAASEFDPTDFNKRCLDPTDNVISPSGNERFIVVYRRALLMNASSPLLCLSLRLSDLFPRKKLLACTTRSKKLGFMVNWTSGNSTVLRVRMDVGKRTFWVH